MPERTRVKTGRARPAASHAGLLAVNIGNSRTVAGLFRDADLVGTWSVTSRALSGDEAWLHLAALGERVGGWPRRLAAVVCSVVPALTPSWQEALARATGQAALEVSAATARSLEISYRDKSSLGPDRIANALGARAAYGTPAIVVDLGTATTFDCLSREGRFLGGVIAPGVVTSAEELVRRTARLPSVELRRPGRVMARTTVEALQAGLLYGAAGQVDALVRRLALEMKGTPHVIATGGLARVIAPVCETVNVVDESLTLKGMRALWEEQG